VQKKNTALAHHFILEHVPYGGEESIKKSVALTFGESVWCVLERREKINYGES
jgi:hypothetical protein